MIFFDARDEATGHVGHEAEADIEALSGLLVLIESQHARAYAVRVMCQALDDEGLDLEGVEQQRQPFAQGLLSRGARCIRHLEAINVDSVDYVLGEAGEKTFEVALSPCEMSLLDNRALVVQ